MKHKHNIGYHTHATLLTLHLVHALLQIHVRCLKNLNLLRYHYSTNIP